MSQVGGNRTGGVGENRPGVTFRVRPARIGLEQYSTDKQVAVDVVPGPDGESVIARDDEVEIEFIRSAMGVLEPAEANAEVPDWVLPALNEIGVEQARV